MNYEKEYKEALERASKYYNANTNKGYREIFEDIFHEFKKSEDERIRKDIIVLVEDWWDRVNKDNISTKEQMIAWLEKQGEQKPADKVEPSCYHNDGLYYAIDILEKTLGKVEGYQSDDGKVEHQIAIETVNALYHKKPAEWSEEDEEMFDAIIADIKFTQKAHNYDVDQVVYEREIDWLKSIKDRIQPQSKQEWGEEDREMIDDTIKAFQLAYPYATEEENPRKRNIDWLKSLKPNHWKPSEEQMKALCNVAFEFGNSCLSPYSDNNKELVSLYNDLLKL